MKPLDAAFAPVPAVLDAAERRLGKRSDEMVDLQIAAFNPIDQPIGGPGGIGEGIGGQTE
jgi:hypothetical protein